MTVPLSLRAKMAVVTRFPRLAREAHWVAGAVERWRKPELSDLFLDERRLPEVMRRLVKETSNILDVGCHIGSFMSLATMLAPKGQHVAIEASPDKAALLKRKLPTVRVESIAISDSCGTASFEKNLTHPGFSRLTNGRVMEGVTATITVPTATLDSLDLGNFDVVKLDIEGAELLALKGATKLFERCRPALIFEYAEPLEDATPIYRFITKQMRYQIFTFSDFLNEKGPLSFDEFRKAVVWPFRAINFLALTIL